LFQLLELAISRGMNSSFHTKRQQQCVEKSMGESDRAVRCLSVRVFVPQRKPTTRANMSTEPKEEKADTEVSGR
jgi:hypothetical protein